MPEGERRGALAWLRRWWRALLAELLATALLVLLGVASTLPAAPPLAHPAWAFGFMVLMNVEVFGPVSGAHMNPAVTLAALLAGRLPALAALGYVLAQLLGAVLGFAALLGAARGVLPTGGAGGTAPAAALGAGGAALVEALLTGALALLCCAVWAAHERDGPDRAASLKLGLTVAGLVFSGGELTGASLNPARSFAPALLQGFRQDHWVYWVGPLGGAAAAALLHRALSPPPRAARPARAARRRAAAAGQARALSPRPAPRARSPAPRAPSLSPAPRRVQTIYVYIKHRIVKFL